LVLVLDVGHFVGHFALVEQVTEVAVLDEPPEELAEGGLETGVIMR
jgi:hypothetical protein